MGDSKIKFASELSGQHAADWRGGCRIAQIDPFKWKDAETAKRSAGSSSRNRLINTVSIPPAQQQTQAERDSAIQLEMSAASRMETALSTVLVVHTRWHQMRALMKW